MYSKPEIVGSAISDQVFSYSTVNGGTLTVGTAAYPVDIMQMVSAATTAQFRVYALPSNGAVTARPEVSMWASRGTYASPTATQSGDCIGMFAGYGYLTAAWKATPGGAVYFNATEAWSATQAGTEIAFWTTTGGSLTSDAKVAISPSGHLRPATAYANLVDLGTTTIPWHTLYLKTSLLLGDVNAGVYSSWATNTTTGSTAITIVGGSAPGFVLSHGVDVGGVISHRDNIRVLNKAGNGWVTWATRDTSGADSKMALTNILSIDSSAYKVGGVAGASFGPGLPTSITVVNGIITAIS